MNTELILIKITNLDEHSSRLPKHFTDVINSINELVAALNESPANGWSGKKPLVDNMDWGQDEAARGAATDALEEMAFQLTAEQRKTLFSVLEHGDDQSPIWEKFNAVCSDIARCAAPWYQHGHNLGFYW